MTSQVPFQLQSLARHPDVGKYLELLTPQAYDAIVQWIARHYSFISGQQIDPSSDPLAVAGSVDDLQPDRLLTLLEQYGAVPPDTLHVIWAYGDFGIALPLSLVSKYLLDDIWFPVTDDVFIVDPDGRWCLELHHEGQFICLRGGDGAYGEVR